MNINDIAERAVKIEVQQTDIIIQQKSEGKDYEELLQLTIPEILKKLLLPKNTCKDHWNTLNVEEIEKRLTEERNELLREIYPKFTWDLDFEKILSEFCDTAAFSLFGIAHCLNELREDHK